MTLEPQALIAWLEREREQRQRIYQARVDEGRMLQAEADYHLAVLAAMFLDHRAWSAPLGEPLPWGAAVPWANKCTWLEAELEQRQRLYARRIDEGRMTRAAADAELAVLADLRAHYVDELFTMPGGMDAARTVRARRDAAGIQGALL